MRRSLIFGLLMFVFSCRVVCGQSADALISEVNALRSSYGLSPYTPDASLSAMAQEHSNYQAEIGQTTHDRADGSGAPCRSENICGGANISADYCVNSMWTDDLHRFTMIGLDSGTVGAGLAQKDGKNYYTLMVNSSGNETGLTGSVSANENAIPEIIDVDALPIQPGTFATSTPELDGSIYHTVQSNETLWSIALSYNTTIERIQQLNGMAEDDIEVAAGSRILIVYGGTPVADTATPTLTPLPPTNTPKPTSTATETPLPLPSFTPTITPTATPEPLIKHIAFFDTPSAKPLGLFLTIFCGVGLLATLYLGFFRKK